ncbi:Uncharacterised protein [Mycobacteroides abscessus]|nr:Uncharacterised protein [Mycobacteroides abscessus]
MPNPVRWRGRSCSWKDTATVSWTMPHTTSSATSSGFVPIGRTNSPSRVSAPRAWT